MPLINGCAVDRLAQTLQPGLVVRREAGIAAAVDETRRIPDADAPEVLYQGAFRDGPLAAVAEDIANKLREHLKDFTSLR